ncbi:MAG: YigZ family protein [Flavobacteriia bacterium]|nr:YigZ family protein [Flavobacteriia bacterium]
MELKSTYRTVAELSEGLYKEKGSKFIAYAIPCYSEEEAKIHLENWRKANHQARHVCYAYRFGVNQDVYRANDDGEPNNSAGIPILGQIQSFDLTNILIGVVRYFGGTKLGVGGLITAYKTAAKDALENANLIEKEIFEWIQLKFDYKDMPSIMSLVKQHNLVIHEQIFELDCQLKLNLPLHRKEILKENLSEFNSVEIQLLGIY